MVDTLMINHKLQVQVQQTKSQRDCWYSEVIPTA